MVDSTGATVKIGGSYEDGVVVDHKRLAMEEGRLVLGDADACLQQFAPSVSGGVADRCLVGFFAARQDLDLDAAPPYGPQGVEQFFAGHEIGRDNPDLGLGPGDGIEECGVDAVRTVLRFGGNHPGSHIATGVESGEEFLISGGR